MASHRKSPTQRYNLKYRRKVQCRRSMSKPFDLEFKAKQNARQRKCRQRKKEAQKEKAIALAPPPTKTASRKIEGVKRRRANSRKLKNDNEKLLIKVQQLQKENVKMKRLLSRQRPEEANTDDTPTSMSPTKLFINNVSPSAKKRATKRLLTEKENLPRGSVSQLRKKLGINLSNDYNPLSNTPSTLQKDVEIFLCHDDVSKQAPDKKKQIRGQQIRYLLNHLSTIHQRFVVETGNNCHYSTFTRYIPDFVVKPNANDWGTCLCVMCLNPQMKFEKLQNLKSRYSIIKSVLIDGLTDITDLVTDESKTKDFKSNLATLKDEQFNITYSEWTKKKNEGSSAPISTKTTVTASIGDFVGKLTKEIEVSRQSCIKKKRNRRGKLEIFYGYVLPLLKVGIFKRRRIFCIVLFTMKMIFFVLTGFNSTY